MKSRFEIFEFPVFGDYCVHVEFSLDFGSTFKKYPMIEDVDALPNEDAVSIGIENEPFGFIFLKPNASAGTIAHECWHAVRRMFRYHGAKLENEMVAYHLGYLVDKIVEFKRRSR